MSNLSIPKRLLKGKKGQNKPTACVSLSISILMSDLILFVRQFETHRASTAISPASPPSYRLRRPNYPTRLVCSNRTTRTASMCSPPPTPAIEHHTLPRRPLTPHHRPFSPAPSPSTTEHAPTSSRSSLWLCATTTTVGGGARCAFVPISPAGPSHCQTTPRTLRR